MSHLSEAALLLFVVDVLSHSTLLKIHIGTTLPGRETFFLIFMYCFSNIYFEMFFLFLRNDAPRKGKKILDFDALY